MITRNVIYNSIKDKFIKLTMDNNINTKCSIKFSTSNDYLFDMFSLNPYVIPIEDIEDLSEENIPKLREDFEFYINTFVPTLGIMFVIENILEEEKDSFVASPVLYVMIPYIDRMIANNIHNMELLKEYLELCVEHEVGHIVDILKCGDNMPYDKFRELNRNNLQQAKEHFEEPAELRANNSINLDLDRFKKLSNKINDDPIKFI